MKGLSNTFQDPGKFKTHTFMVPRIHIIVFFYSSFLGCFMHDVPISVFRSLHFNLLILSNPCSLCFCLVSCEKIHKVPSRLMLCTIPITMTAGSIHVHLLIALLSLVNPPPVPAEFPESDVTWAHQILCIPVNRKQTSNKHSTGFVWFDSL